MARHSAHVPDAVCIFARLLLGRMRQGVPLYGRTQRLQRMAGFNELMTRRLTRR